MITIIKTFATWIMYTFVFFSVPFILAYGGLNSLFYGLLEGNIHLIVAGVCGLILFVTYSWSLYKVVEESNNAFR